MIKKKFYKINIKFFLENVFKFKVLLITSFLRKFFRDIKFDQYFYIRTPFKLN